MGTLLDVKEYFKDDNLPHGHPWQDGVKNTPLDDRNPKLDKKDSEKTSGYAKDNMSDNSKAYNKIKKNKG